MGQYEKLVGKAFGEVNPHDRQNADIVDIELAPRNARGNVEYSFDFYILKPIDLKKGAHKVMYEPPNRGGKTWDGARPRVRRRQRPGLDHRPDGARELVPDAARLHHGVERLGQRLGRTSPADLDATITLPIAKNPRRLRDHRPGLRVHRDLGGGTFSADLSGGDAGQDARRS